MRIIADVLSAARDLGKESGVGVTILLRRANLSHSRLVILLSDLVKSGLLVMEPYQRGSRYRISPQGLQFLEAYRRFEDFAHAYGLRI
ncbi:MAG: winged helix-turn-helix domain-containing protein [Nitrososphaerales archaeon]